ncbi:hypothetical protein EQG49_00670 [Periweissella cryptocerci]|uniref:Uncharacterized protein n=1 Tax=Periweissella cryptocerci TaxID=2506420 RepID=A0A4P6YR26_9LACO|nr:hypothetical protein [Periweissella cryptocerci]QBO35067.1 hypothetical protein EQG49_00670 [Periweissella cryptocerci]
MLDVYDLFEIASDFLFDDVLGYVKNEKKSKLIRLLLLTPLALISLTFTTMFVLFAQTDHWLLMFFSGLIAFYTLVHVIRLVKVILQKRVQQLTTKRGY